MGNQQVKGRSHGRKIKWENAEKPLPPGKPYLVPDCDEGGADFITVGWSPPMSDGGAPILGYSVEHRRTGSPHWLRAVPYLVEEAKLTLTGLEPGWRYQFRVSAENGVGRSVPGEVSEVLTVTSQRSAATSPHFNVELRDAVALENEKVEFTVHVVAIPQATISWYKDGFEVFSSRRMKIVTENDQSTLIIHQAALEDEGEIKCTATNRAGHSVTKAILKLEAPPRVRLPRRYEDGLLFEKGEPIRLKVSVAGRPAPVVTWFHDGELLSNDARFEIRDAERNSTLRISEARRGDRGEYVVRGVNKIGEDVASFLVTVTDRPQPPGKTKVVMALGRSVTLSWTSPEDDGGCRIGSYTVEYFRVGWNMWLKAATCRQLTTVLSELIEGSEYRFRVKAENPYGMSEPGEPSDIVFIPDSKRGVLAPPPRGNLPDIDVWLNRDSGASAEEMGENAQSHIRRKGRALEESVRKLSDTSRSVSSAAARDGIEPAELPPKRAHVDTEEDGVPPPVPKRRHRAEKYRNTPSPEHLMDAGADEVRRDTLSESSGFTAVKSEEDADPRLPREKDHTIFHGSSELMLVLLPQEGEKAIARSSQHRSEMGISLIGDGVAPPMSLSAPELGCSEPMELQPLRNAASSSELLHERAITRLYQDTVREESEREIRRRYGGDRKSLERRPSFREGTVSEKRQHGRRELAERPGSAATFHTEEDHDPETTEVNSSSLAEVKAPGILGPPKKEPDRTLRLNSIEKEQQEFALVRERIRLKNERSTPRTTGGARSPFGQMSTSSTSSQVSSSGGDSVAGEDDKQEEDYWDDGEDGNTGVEELGAEMRFPLANAERRSVSRVHSVPARTQEPEGVAPFAREEDTCCPMTMRIVLPRLEITPATPVEIEKDRESKGKDPAGKHLREKGEVPAEAAPEKKPKKRAAQILRRLGLKKARIPEVVTEVDGGTWSSGASLPKPILKNKPTGKKRDRGRGTEGAADRRGASWDDISDDGSKRKKQVRIAEPDEMPGDGKPMASQPGKQQMDENELANRVLICHYSDIVREFGNAKKLPPRQYLKCEELQAVVRSERKQSATEKDTGAEAATAEQCPTNEDVRTPPEASSMVNSDKRSKSFAYLTDIAMFLVACWLYLFSNELYAVPVLCLMVYRQVSDLVKNRCANLADSFSERFRKRKLENG